MTPINLVSVMIGKFSNALTHQCSDMTNTLGNGDTQFDTMILSYYDVQCMDYGFPQVVSIS